MAFNNNTSALWDLSLPPSLPSLADDEFVALLQKQFGASNDGAVPVTDKQPPNGFNANINPQQLSRFPSAHDTSSPLSDDEDEDSPSPPSASVNSRSRKQSGSMRERQRSIDEDDDHAPKRKASEEDLDDEPNHKSQHTSSSKKASTSAARRKSTGNTNPDESRLLKRKEQNRAAQRAFRERKEKHVKDLEDKVAALEERNQVAVSENESLREVIGRLQSENMKLRQSSFTFSMPPTSEPSKDPSSSTGNADTPLNNPFTNPPSSGSTSSTSSTHDSPQSLFLNEKPDSSPMSIFNNPNLHVIEPEQTATGDAMGMGMDFGFGPVIADTPYTTLASNPLFMSFREPDVYAFGDTSSYPQNHGSNQVNGNNGGFDFSQNYPAWPDVNMDVNMQAFDLTNSLDELFGGNFNTSNTMDYASFLKNSPSNSISPVSHRNGNSPAATISNSTSSSSSSSSGASPASQPSPSAANNSSPSANGVQNTASFGATSDGFSACDSSKKCTKEMLRHAVANDSGSMFAPKEPSPPVIALDGVREFIPCKNMNLPKTQKSDQNMEVMSAWRRIRTDPKYTDIDINKLCSEFAAKARCDGSQVVIEPNGMREILSTVTRRNGTPLNQA
ncbi:hypothetical protein SCHPADRAFT_1002416 [Schizopora paradoxa]|uniref:BZIP domain-containing protein n=1 Tax=Schizopora paradoxa TaxID=27342 RepID=A0A0H2R4N9_9AGAM|nr:hypothetical protein SCHPADRAFT_1002416 [Schizopora paradoxa]